MCIRPGAIIREEKESQDRERRKETLNKARNNIIRLIASNQDMTTFITLTFKDGQDYKSSKKLLNNLFNKLRRDYKNLKYLWVLEYGSKNNRLHYHLLCNIPIEVKTAKTKEKKSQDHKQLEKEFCRKYWKHGFVDIRNLAEEGNTNVGLYISTYIVKSLENTDMEGFRVYGYSNKTLEKPVETKYFTHCTIEEILSQYKDNYNFRYANNYKIGYADFKGVHEGNVCYFHLELKEGLENEN